MIITTKIICKSLENVCWELSIFLQRTEFTGKQTFFSVGNDELQDLYFEVFRCDFVCKTCAKTGKGTLPSDFSC